MVGMGKRAISAEIPLGCANAPHARRQRGASAGPTPTSAKNVPDGSPVNYWFKTGVVDEGRGFMQGRAETKQGDQVVGSYEYSDGHVKVKVVYTADERGYRVVKEERVTLKPFIKNEIPFKKSNDKRRPVSSKHRNKDPYKSTHKVKNIADGKYSSSYAAESSQGLVLANLEGYDVKMSTDHLTGFSQQGFSSQAVKPPKFKTRGSDFHNSNNHNSGIFHRPSINHHDDYNLSLEMGEDLVNKPSVKTVTRTSFGPNSRGKSKYSLKDQRVKSSGSATSYAVQNSRPSKPLFKPFESNGNRSVGFRPSRSPFFKPATSRPTGMRT